MGRDYTYFISLLLVSYVLFCNGNGNPVSGDGQTSLLESEIHLITESQDLPNINRCKDNHHSGKSSSIVQIVSRKEWNSPEIKHEYAIRTSPVPYVVITQRGERCMNAEECVALMQWLSRDTPSIFLENFYIGEDGKVYEGLGWDIYRKDIAEGLDKFSLWITFWGSFQEVSPSPIALEALRALINAGVSQGKILPNYKLITALAVMEFREYFLDKILEELKCWDHYTDHLEVPFERDHPTAGLFPIVFREEWNATKANRTFESVSMPIEYILVTSYSYRCFTTYSCIKFMQMDQRFAKDVYGDVLLNFYVGEDGLTYEGRGWDVVPAQPEKFPKIDLPRNLISVAFHGFFNSIKPTQSALLAFQKFLRLGVMLGKISPNYQIVSGRIIAEVMVGKGLQSELVKMERYRDTLDRGEFRSN